MKNGTKTGRTVRVTRRALLKGAAATLVFAAGVGVWRAVDQGVFDPDGGPAYEPWANWRTDGETGPLALVPAAILASNAHNTQPWLFRIGDSRIDLFADRTRNIGAVDPLSRELDISLGCALENLLLAARAKGYDYRLTLVPDRSDPAHVARADLAPGGTEVSALYEAIPHRHTNRYAYDTARPISGETVEALRALNDDGEVGIFWFAEEVERRRMGDLLVEAAEVMNADQEQSFDNIERWLRHDWDAVQRHRDGLTLDALGLSTFELIAAKMLPRPSLARAKRSWLQTEERQVATAAAFGILAVRDDGDPGQRMRVGRLWQRMHLWLTSEGLAAQPLNQLHERADREAQLGIAPRFGDAVQGLLGDPAWRGIFTFRLGFPTEEAPPSPRRSVEDIVEERGSP
jgi:nitroreductase